MKLLYIVINTCSVILRLNYTGTWYNNAAASEDKLDYSQFKACEKHLLNHQTMLYRNLHKYVLKYM